MPFSRHFQFLPERASSVAGRVDALFWFLCAVSAAMTLLILVLIVLFALRYRRRTEDEVPPETQSHPMLEVGWSAATFVVMLVMFFWGATLYVDIKRPAQAGTEINVIGKQWMWKVQHPGGQREINELHVPVNRPIKLIMASQDVIHSFEIPAFRIKQDVVPGSYSTQWFTATRVGEYHLFCQEYCGTLQSGMVGRVVVMDGPEFDAWLAGTAPAEDPVASGAKLFTTYGCAQCHGQTAPTLAGLFGRTVELEGGAKVVADEDYLRESILDPTAKVVAGYPRLMPSFRGQLGEEQVSDLVSYVKALGGLDLLHALLQ
jgi:cytochrome c oxidase subunit 2